MSQSNRAKKAPEAPRKPTEVPQPTPGGITPLGVMAAAVVVVLFLVLGLMLARPAGQQTAAAPTAEPFAATPAAADPAATAAPADAPAAAAGDIAARNNMYSAPPPMAIDPARQYTATITTPRGDIVIRLRPDIAPQTVNSFVFLAREGFYDGTTWHRVLENFMAQGGDPTGTGTGGPGYNVPAEFTPETTFDRPGLVAMARSSDPDSAGSQFFITTAVTPWLDGQYTIFGEVIEGQEIVNAIPLRDPQQNPSTPGEQMLSVTIAEE